LRICILIVGVAHCRGNELAEDAKQQQQQQQQQQQ